MITDQEIVDGCNRLAQTFYERRGYKVPAGYKFYAATHPQEVECWDMAVQAYDHIEGTDVEQALMIVEDDK